MTKRQIEEKLIEMFFNQQQMESFVDDDMGSEESGLYFRGVKNVRPFSEYICTMDNGVVVDLADGTQICLTIQAR